MDESPEMTIGEVARRAGVATSSIRYYERRGLLPEPARLRGRRRYDAAVLGRLGFIGVAQGAGFKLREVEALLERTRAMKAWLEVAKECSCASPAECTLFAADGPAPQIVQVDGSDCRIR
jgi:DNA-binding transcriptional MerR regulator